MDNFDLRKYLAEGRLLKENISQFEDYISALYDFSVAPEDEGPTTGIWEKDEYADSEKYEDADQFIALSSYLDEIGGKATLEGNPDIKIELLPSGNIKWFADITHD